MGLRNTTEGWGWLARALHWIIGAIIIFLIGLGFYTDNFVTDIYEQFGLIQLHKSWGFTVFILVAIRLVWRLVNPAPPMPDGMKRWERFGAHVGHYGLYALMIVMPLSGWLMSSASELQELYNIKNMVFGLFEMPDPFQPGDKALEEVFGTIHWACAILMTVLIIGHAAAALKHHFVVRDNVLRRMIIGR